MERTKRREPRPARLSKTVSKPGRYVHTKSQPFATCRQSNRSYLPRSPENSFRSAREHRNQHWRAEPALGLVLDRLARDSDTRPPALRLPALGWVLPPGSRVSLTVVPG